jgi:dolichol-phosphate mannosyltransferase
MGTLWLAHERAGLDFVWAQTLAVVVAMTFNYVVNNELTYANKKLRGWRFWTGLLTFYAVCSIGALANISVASWIYQFDGQFYVAGLLGVLMSVVFNYSVTRVFTWR